MTDDDERDRLAEDLLRLSLPELVDVLRRVLPAHQEAGSFMSSALVLAQVSQPSGVDPVHGHPSTELVAWPDRDFYDGGFGPEPGLWEQGTCPGCKVEVTSTAKRAFCPHCGTLCQLT
ncbi:hypothetical protein E1200_21275 [Actinomadura sp. GC306]|uniref:hypothetical protein n=1 Tax=Actinomadura sp. GC306 TaxID=2530367 RepID=UPI00104BDDD0|nr:hypothetical protein [Actinomadura sp. GC306]TDC63920.1 hypothetical protein E1200_21275 [Actinomadura sp. GC306]